ncbi:MAG: hypothetical protein KI790_03665 [Cyclobacteriaceae bacterium]|nr:hypothetical protein [Cyclobacteriaceae bacterium HetDA_MAG_MS6]
MTYSFFLATHSTFRWLVLASITLSIALSVQGLISKRSYSSIDNLSRIIAGAITHTQLLIGFIFYFVISPITRSFMSNGSGGNDQITFFGIYHILMMTTAIVVMTIGSSKAKRIENSELKFKTITMWFSISLLLILLAIPWFRPFLRTF